MNRGLPWCEVHRVEAGETRPESKQDVLDVYCLLRRALLDTLANSCSRGMHGDDDGGGDELMMRLLPTGAGTSRRWSSCRTRRRRWTPGRSASRRRWWRRARRRWSCARGGARPCRTTGTSSRLATGRSTSSAASRSPSPSSSAGHHRDIHQRLVIDLLSSAPRSWPHVPLDQLIHCN